MITRPCRSTRCAHARSIPRERDARRRRTRSATQPTAGGPLRTVATERCQSVPVVRLAPAYVNAGPICDRHGPLSGEVCGTCVGQRRTNCSRLRAAGSLAAKERDEQARHPGSAWGIDPRCCRVRRHRSHRTRLTARLRPSPMSTVRSDHCSVRPSASRWIPRPESSCCWIDRLTRQPWGFVCGLHDRTGWWHRGIRSRRLCRTRFDLDGFDRRHSRFDARQRRSLVACTQQQHREAPGSQRHWSTHRSSSVE